MAHHTLHIHSYTEHEEIYTIHTQFPLRRARCIHKTNTQTFKTRVTASAFRSQIVPNRIHTNTHTHNSIPNFPPRLVLVLVHLLHSPTLSTPHQSIHPIHAHSTHWKDTQKKTEIVGPATKHPARNMNNYQPANKSINKIKQTKK